MSGYSKNIAVLHGIKNGFSADGGPLSGIVKAEKYGVSLKVDISLINFAPVTEGRYVAAISDGKHICVMDGVAFEGNSEVDTSKGFAVLICYVNTEVLPVASAICGAFQSAAIGIREEIERVERTNLKYNPSGKKFEEEKYEDEALAQENYYEYEQTDESSGIVCENPQEEKNGKSSFQNETASCSFEENGVGGLAGGEFFEKMKEEIEKILTSYPKEDSLENTVENSRWVRINYGENKFYVFGVIYGEGKPQYICYGVPSSDSIYPPESLKGLASFIPSSPEGGSAGYWVMYQDAATGASIKISIN